MSSLPAPASRSGSSPGLNSPGAALDDGKSPLNPMAREFVPDNATPASASGASVCAANEAATAATETRNATSRGLRSKQAAAQNAVKLNAEDRKVRYDPIAKPRPRASSSQQQRRPYRKQAYDKDLFLQANFRFLVSDFGNYVENTVDPDKMLEWEDIAAVELLSTGPVQCPICLDEQPLCPQITSCGHVFCFPCILRYMMIEEASGHRPAEHWKKCPLCFSMICCKELRTVFIHEVKRYDVGDEIEFTLLKRAKGFVIPLQNNELQNNESGCALAYSEDGQCDLFSKFTLTSDMEKTTNRAISELRTWAEAAQHGGMEDLERLPYIFASVDELKSRKLAWDEHRTEELLSSSPPLKQKIMVQGRAGNSSLPEGSKQYKAKASEVVKTDKKEPVFRVNAYTDEQELVAEPENVADEESTLEKPEESYSFYQAADGQLIILHPFNMKCVTRHYGGYTNLPLKLRGKICESESITQTETSRRRYRYLSHLPLTSVVQLCEIDLSKSLPSSALIPFAEELRVRDQRRKRRAQKEKQMKTAEERREATAKPPSHADFAAMLGVLHDQMIPTSADFTNDLVPTAPVTVSPPVEGRKLFSSVTRMGFAAGHDAPDLVGASSSNGPSKSSPWKTAASTENSALSFADVIQKEKAATSASAEQSSSRKGKKTSRILLSTAGRRY